MLTAQGGTKGWLEWRRQGLGSSDAPIVMRASPWRTPFQLWEEKTGRSQGQQANWAMQRGTDLEGKARANYELLADCEMPPTLLVHPEVEFLRASLDGYNRQAKRVLEIKCPGEDDHRLAMDGKVPEKYQWQLIHQLMVSGAEVAHYYSFRNDRGVIVEFQRDLAREEILFKAELDFWNLIKTDSAPPLSDRDFLQVSKTKAAELWEIAALWKQLEEQEKEIAERLEATRKRLLQEAAKLEAPRMRVAGVQLMKVTRKGTVDYGKIPQLKGVNLETFRKKSIEYVDVRVMKE